MLRRKKKTQNELLEAEAQAAEEAARQAQQQEKFPQKKGVPTPSRKEQERARKRPLVAGNRKEAKKAQRNHMAQERAKMRRAMDTGDDRYLPLRDRGPQKRFVRDYVDARTGLGEWLLVIVVLFLFASFVMTEEARAMSAFSLWILMGAVILECFWIGRQVRKKGDAKFGIEKREKSLRFYAVMRSLQLRMLRLPKPQVKRGEHPS